MASAKLAAKAGEVLARNRENALKLAGDDGVERVRDMLVEAQQDLAKRLAAKVKSLDADAFTAVQMRATMEQLKAVTQDLTSKLRGVVLETGSRAAEAAAEDTIRYLQAADQAFRGTGITPLALKEAGMFDSATQGARASVLSHLASGGEPVKNAAAAPHKAKMGVLQRYGVETIRHFERKLQLGMVQGKSWGEMEADITSQSAFLQQAPASWAARIVRTECLVGDTPVSAAVVRAAFRRWYEGDVLEVVTEGGRHLTTTPNHPMLTQRSWVESKSIAPGDYLVCDGRKQDHCSPGHDHVEGRPPTVREVFDSLAAVGIREDRRGSRPDFHGDGMQGQVEVLRPDGELRVGDFTPVYEPAAQKVLAPSDLSRSRFCAACGRLLSVYQQPCGCRRPRFHPRFLQAALDRFAVGPEFLAEALRTFAGLVSPDDLFGRQILAAAGMPQGGEPVERGFGSAAHAPRLLQRAFYPAHFEPQLLGGSVRAEAGCVELDRVRSVRVKRFAGHVYNLETPHGYFAINGAYTGNCMGAYNRASWEGVREADEQLGDMCKILSSPFDERTASDSYATHGQIRRPEEPFETWYGEMQHPPDRPNDRGTFVPHRISWVIPPYLAWRDDDEVQAAWEREGHKEEMPERPEMTTIGLELFGKEQPKKIAPGEEQADS